MCPPALERTSVADVVSISNTRTEKSQSYWRAGNWTVTRRLFEHWDEGRDCPRARWVVCMGCLHLTQSKLWWLTDRIYGLLTEIICFCCEIPNVRESELRGTYQYPERLNSSVNWPTFGPTFSWSPSTLCNVHWGAQNLSQASVVFVPVLPSDISEDEANTHWNDRLTSHLSSCHYRYSSFLQWWRLASWCGLWLLANTESGHPRVYCYLLRRLHSAKFVGRHRHPFVTDSGPTEPIFYHGNPQCTWSPAQTFPSSRALRSRIRVCLFFFFCWPWKCWF